MKNAIVVMHKVFTYSIVFCFFVFRAILFAADPSESGVYRVPLANEPDDLDPAHITGIYAISVGMNIFDGLVEYDENLNIVPAIADKWIISRDHRKYTFFLKKGVRFHNGREVVADDFVYSLSRLLDPKIKSPVASFFMNILGAEAFHAGERKTVDGLGAPDAHTLRIELREPFAPFISILAMINAKVVPKEAVGKTFGRSPMGTGPFLFRTWVPGKKIILSQNPDYFAGPPALKTVAFHIYSNELWDDIFADFENGDLDQTNVPRDRYDDVMSIPEYKKKYRLMSIPGLNLVYIGMNQAIPPFDDLRVRMAVSHAVDTETISNEITRGGSVPAKSILPPGIAGFDPDFKGYAYDPEKARKLLSQSGYSQKEPVEIWTVSKSESVKTQLDACRKYLAEVGIQIVPRFAENWKTFLDVIDNKKAHMFYAAWYADYPDADNFLYVLFHSTSRTNRMAYQNEETDRLLEDARHESDYLRRAELYRKAEKRIMGEAPVICLHNNTFNTLFQPWVRGIEMGHLGSAYTPFRKVSMKKKQLGKNGDMNDRISRFRLKQPNSQNTRK